MLASTNLFSIVEALITVFGIMGSLGVIALGVLAYQREDHNRPLIPWGARMQVEKSKANLELDAIEIKRMALDHQRTKVLEAIQNDDTETVQLLGLPSANGSEKSHSPYL